MTAAEVLAAVEWQTETLSRIAVEAEHVFQIIEAIEAGKEVGALTPAELAQADKVFAQLATEQMRQGQLLELILITIPQWSGEDELTLAEAVRQFWPR